MSPVVQRRVVDTFFNVQEVKATLVTAENMFPLQTCTNKKGSVFCTCCGGVCCSGTVCVCAYLVAGVVLLEAGVVAHHPQAVLTQQVSRVGVSGVKMRPDIRVEGRSEAAHLQAESRAQ